MALCGVKGCYTVAHDVTWCYRVLNGVAWLHGVTLC